MFHSDEVSVTKVASVTGRPSLSSYRCLFRNSGSLLPGGFVSCFSLLESRENYAEGC